MEAKEKVSFIHSITAKIMLMVVVMVALSLMACISIANVRASATVNNVNENFILSLTESAAKTLDKIPAEVDFSTQCAAVMQDMRMEGVSSAYGYLVDSDGTMLYHPTADKIGKSVENEVVKGVVSQLQSGNIPQDAVVTYNFNGTVKYAAYALTSDHKIVVMSADKGEIMEPITNMVRLMQITMGVCLIICCLAALVLTNMITKPIHQLTYIITRTANFDFTHNANSRRLYSRKDEIGIMAAEMHIMRKNLRDMVASIQDAGQKINENVSELNEVTDTVNQMCSDNSATSQQLGMPQGVFIYKIVEGGAASKSDLREKDIITKFDGQSIKTYDDLTNMLKYYEGGTTVTVTVQSLENGQYVERNVDITLDKKPVENSVN